MTNEFMHKYATFKTNVSKFTRKNSHLFIFVIIIVQPLLDIATFFLESSEGKVMMFIRVFILLLTVGWGMSVSRSRRSLLVLLSVIGLFWIARALVSISSGDQPLSLNDVSVFVKLATLPIFLYVFTTLVRANKEVKQYALLSLAWVLAIISTSVLLAWVTNSGELSYPDGGFVGWFRVPNAQSAILAVVAPFALYYAVRKQKPWTYATLSILAFLLLFIIGTRVSYYGIIVIMLIMLTVLLLSRVRVPLYYVATSTVLIATCLLHSTSPMNQHRAYNSDVFTERQAEHDSNLPIGDVARNTNTTRPGRGAQPSELEQKLCDNTYSQNMVHGKMMLKKFGCSAVLYNYNYTEDLRVLADQRKAKHEYAELQLQRLPEAKKLFGMTTTDFKIEGGSMMLENDFSAMRYLVGWIGFVIYLVPFIYIIYLAIRLTIQRPRRLFNANLVFFTGILVLLIGAAELSGNVLTRPSATIYMALVMTFLIYYLRKEFISEKNE